MKKVFFIILIIHPNLCVAQKDSINRPEYFFGFTPIKPWIVSSVGITFHAKQTNRTYLGIESYIYMNDNESALYGHPKGIKLYGAIRSYHSQKRPSSFYSQINGGCGYFFDEVDYVNKDFEGIFEFKRYMAFGGSAQIGYHLIFTDFSFDFNLGFQIFKRVLKKEIQHQGQTFSRNRGAYESTFSDSEEWAIYGPGSVLNANFA